MFLKEESSSDLNLLTEQEDSIRIHFGNLLNIVIDRHLKLLYFKVPNRPTHSMVYNTGPSPTMRERTGDRIREVWNQSFNNFLHIYNVISISLSL